MRRNMDLIRAIALGRDTGEYTQEEIEYHVYLMGQAQLALVINSTTAYQGSPVGILVTLTHEGHDFADLASDEAWAWAKNLVAKVGGSTTFDMWVWLLKKWQDYRMEGRL